MDVYLFVYAADILSYEPKQILPYSSITTLGAEIASYSETHDATQIEGGRRKELGTEAGDHY